MAKMQSPDPVSALCQRSDGRGMDTPHMHSIVRPPEYRALALTSTSDTLDPACRSLLSYLWLCQLPGFCWRTWPMQLQTGTGMLAGTGSHFSRGWR